MVTGVEVIIAALAAGAAAGTTDVAKTALTDAYTAMRDVLRRRLAGRRRAQEALDARETEPGRWAAILGQDLADSGADTDVDVLTEADRVLELTDPEGVKAGKYVLDPRSGHDAQGGGHTVHVGTSYGPTAGTISGPVTVTYGQLPDPPTRPRA